MALPPKSTDIWYALTSDELTPDEPTTVYVIDVARARVLAVDRGPNALKNALRKACTEPFDKRARRPARVDVASEQAAASLHGAMPGVAVAIATQPDEAVTAALNALEAGPRVPGGAAGAIAAAGARLLAAEPWLAFDDEPIPFAIADLGIERGAIIVIGQNGTHFGFVLFRSASDALAHIDQVDRGSSTGRAIPHLVLELERAGDIEPELRRTLQRAVGRQPRYAIGMRVTAGRELMPADADELVLLARVAEALAAALGSEPNDDGTFERGGVTLELPTDELPNEKPVFGIDYFEPSDAATPDLQLLGRIAAWADEHHVRDYEREVMEPFPLPRLRDPFAAALWLWPRLLLAPEDTTFSARFRETETLSSEEAAILAAQEDAWTSIWEIGARTGDDVELSCQLTGERRVVSAVGRVAELQAGSYVCARVVHDGAACRICACDPTGLKPGPLGEVMEAIRVDVGWPPDALANVEAARTLRVQTVVIETWDDLMFDLAGDDRLEY